MRKPWGNSFGPETVEVQSAVMSLHTVHACVQKTQLSESLSQELTTH